MIDVDTDIAAIERQPLEIVLLVGELDTNSTTSEGL